MELTITPRILAALKCYVTRWDLCFDDMARDAGVSCASGHDTDEFIPLRPFLRLLELCAERTGDELLGMHFGEQLPHGSLGLFHYIVVNAPTVGAALQVCVNYAQLTVNAGVITFVETDGVGYYTWHFPEELQPRTQYIGFVVSLTISRIRHILQKPWTPRRVDLEMREPAVVEEVRRIVGHSLRFETAPTRIVIDSSDLLSPSAPANKFLFNDITRVAQRQTEALSNKQNLITKITDAINESLPYGKVCEVDVCARLSISVRTLQRDLADRGMTFRQVLDDAKKQRAQHLLTTTTLSLTEISFLLGYAELSAFSRAAKHWFGVPASSVRDGDIK
jgi:AraC-like DNA-binding protein